MKAGAVVLIAGVAAASLIGLRDLAYNRLFSAACEGRLTELRLWLLLPLDLERTLTGRETPMICAAVSGQADSIRALRAHGANPNVPGKLGYTPLEGAVYHDRTDAVSALIEAGADVNLRGEEGRPLSVAVEKCRVRAAELLIRAGANTDLDYGTGTIRDYAMREGCSAVQEIFRKLPGP